MSDQRTSEPGARFVPAPVRLGWFLPEHLTIDQRELYDAIVGGPRAQPPHAFPLTDDAGRLLGPFNAMLLSPMVGGALQGLGSAIRHHSTVSDRQREIAILLVAHHWRSQFEIYAHERVARSAGLSEHELDALRERRFGLFTERSDLAIVAIVSALLAEGDLRDEQYASAVASIGTKALFEITCLVGYYATLALQLRVFGVSDPITS